MAFWPVLGVAQEAQTLMLDREALRGEVREYLLEHPEVLMEAFNVLQKREAEAKIQVDMDVVAKNSQKIFNDGASYVGGNLNGDVTIVEFIDYNCGYCKKALPALEQLINTDANVRYIIKELPILSEDSVAAARFSLAVKDIYGDEVYVQVHETFLSSRQPITLPVLTQVAETYGLEMADIFLKMESAEVSEIIENNHTLSRALGLSGTPAFIFGNQIVRGYVPFEGMEEIIAQVRSQK